MSPPYEGAPTPESGAPNHPTGRSTDKTESSRSARAKPTQLQRVLRLLTEQDEVCGSEFYRAYLPRFGARLWELKEQGYVWSKRPCDRHDHETNAFLYRLIATPPKPEGEACQICGGVLVHTSGCASRELEKDPDQLFGGLL